MELLEKMVKGEVKTDLEKLSLSELTTLHKAMVLSRKGDTNESITTSNERMRLSLMAGSIHREMAHRYTKNLVNMAETFIKEL